jgi:hypothetical protein
MYELTTVKTVKCFFFLGLSDQYNNNMLYLLLNLSRIITIYTHPYTLVKLSIKGCRL